MSDEAKLDAVYLEVDLYLRNGMFSTVDHLLSTVNFKNTSPYVLVGYAAVSYPARDKLTYRSVYMTNLAAHLKEMGEDADEILRGLH